MAFFGKKSKYVQLAIEFSNLFSPADEPANHRELGRFNPPTSNDEIELSIQDWQANGVAL
jgi:hypothetical protein